jgi:eukaryotic-like serine/threonine-protein kinase
VSSASTGASRSSEESRALLQLRVSKFAFAVGSLTLMGTLVRFGMLSMGADALGMLDPHTLWVQTGGALALLGIWALTRSGQRSARFVRIVETAGLVIAGAAFEIVALALTQSVVTSRTVRELEAEPTVLGLALLAPLIATSFVLTYVLIIRAAFVPTQAKHTALLTALIGAPLVLVAYQAGTGTVTFGGPTAAALAIGAATQWFVTVCVCSLISKVIYGLRQEVHEAQRLGQYTLESIIGEGGMGVVYRASHAMLRRPTAIKLLAVDRAGAASLERFEREVQLTAQLTHPNTITIYDYGRTADGVLYYAMELLDGATLEEVVEIDGPQPPARVIRIMEQVAGALGEAHSIGLIHRDVKPANIVLCRKGGELDVAKVVDFGLVKELDKRHAVTVSQEGTISGTPLYMAPEILTESNAASARSDLYALGAVGYYLLTGEHVFGGKTVIEVLGHHLHSSPIPPSQRLGDPVPEDLERVILDCLDKDPSKRPQSAAELRQRLEACDSVSRWMQKSAEKWWAIHGATLDSTRRQDRASRYPTRMMTVDLVNRSQEELETLRSAS